MFTDKFVFSQLTAFLDRNHFNYLARKYNGDKYVKHLTCWNQLLALMFGQLSNRESLRDLIVALEAHQSKCFHLGLGRKPIAKTTLGTATTASLRSSPSTWWSRQGWSGQKMSLSSVARSMRLTQRRYHSACRCSGGQSSVRRKAVSRPMSSTTWRHKYQPSTTSPLPRSMIPRRCRKFPMRQMLTTSLTEATTTSRSFSAYSGWSHFLSLEPRQTCSTNASSGSGGCPRTSSLTRR